jgi:hypothetical protein
VTKKVATIASLIFTFENPFGTALKPLHRALAADYVRQDNPVVRPSIPASGRTDF